MNSFKRMLIILLLSVGFLQAPSANAQVAQLLGIAGQMAPAIIPVVLTGVITGAMTAPALVKEWVHMPTLPHFTRSKKTAATVATNNKDISDKNSDTKVSTNESIAKEAASAPGIESEPATSNELDVAVQQKKPSDNSQWFMDDDSEQSRSRAVSTSQSEIPSVSRKPEPSRNALKVSTKVQGTLVNTAPLNAESATAEKAVQDTNAENSAADANGEGSASPVIMMKLSR